MPTKDDGDRRRRSHLSGFAGTAQASVISFGSVLPEEFESTEFANRTLKGAKSMLRRAGCKLGHVKKVNAPKPKKIGKVLKQAPYPGKVLAPGSRVRIQLGE